MTGLGRRLKEHDPTIRVISVLPEVFPGIESLKPLGGPEDIVPAILDETVIDERTAVTSGDADKMCARLARAGFFVGQSSGAYMVGVERIARRERAGRFVTLPSARVTCPDFVSEVIAGSRRCDRTRTIPVLLDHLRPDVRPLRWGPRRCDPR